VNLINVWRAIALECLYREYRRSNWPATRRGLMRETSVLDLMLLWGVRVKR